MWTTKLSAEGQLVLPQAIQEKLGIKPGDEIVFIMRDNRVEVQAQSSDILSWYGTAKVDGPQDWAEVKVETGRLRSEEVIRELEGD